MMAGGGNGIIKGGIEFELKQLEEAYLVQAIFEIQLTPTANHKI